MFGKTKGLIKAIVKCDNFQNASRYPHSSKGIM